MALDVLCAGAVKGLVLALDERFAADPDGAPITATFNAVGALRDALRGGAACDVLVLTEALLASLEASGEVAAGTRVAIGSVATGMAVVDGAAGPDLADAASLRTALLAASALYLPDGERSTAGAHVISTLQRLGVHAELAPKLRMFANGATAMRALADSSDLRALGCTQATEIRYTAGLRFVGALPAEFGLATVYSAAVAARANDPALARRFIALLTGPDSVGLRRAGGFDL